MTTLLPPPDAAALTRAAISAVEALRLYAVTLGADDDRRPATFAADHAGVELRREEVRAACQILGATLDDMYLRDDARRAWGISAQVRLRDDLDLDDLAGFEAWCRELAGPPPTQPNPEVAR